MPSSGLSLLRTTAMVLLFWFSNFTRFFCIKIEQLKYKNSLLSTVLSKAGKTEGHLVPTLDGTHNSNTLGKEG